MRHSVHSWFRIAAAVLFLWTGTVSVCGETGIENRLDRNGMRRLVSADFSRGSFSEHSVRKVTVLAPASLFPVEAPVTGIRQRLNQSLKYLFNGGIIFSSLFAYFSLDNPYSLMGSVLAAAPLYLFHTLIHELSHFTAYRAFGVGDARLVHKYGFLTVGVVSDRDIYRLSLTRLILAAFAGAGINLAFVLAYAAVFFIPDLGLLPVINQVAGLSQLLLISFVLASVDSLVNHAGAFILAKSRIGFVGDGGLIFSLLQFARDLKNRGIDVHRTPIADIVRYREAFLSTANRDLIVELLLGDQHARVGGLDRRIHLEDFLEETGGSVDLINPNDRFSLAA